MPSRVLIVSNYRPIVGVGQSLFQASYDYRNFEELVNYFHKVSSIGVFEFIEISKSVVDSLFSSKS